MKRKIYNLIVFFLVLAILTCNVYAVVSATIKINATNTKLKKGEDFKVTLSLDNVDSSKTVTSVVGYINVDTSVLEEVEFEDINKDEDGTVTIGNEKLIVEDLTDKKAEEIPDTVYCVSFNGHPVSGNQSKILIDMRNGLTSNANLLTIDFHVKDDANVGTYEDAISYKMFLITEGDEVTSDPGITKNIGVEVVESETKSVTYSPKATDSVSLRKGETKQYKATFDGNDVTENTKITWELDGSYKSGTKIEKGLLTIASDETASEVKFKVTEKLSSEEGTTTEFKVNVIKDSEGEKKVVYSPSNVEEVSVKKGESKQYKATYDGKDVTTDSKITWTLDGTYKSGTKIEKGLLTVASDESLSEIKFKVKEVLSSEEGTTTEFKVKVLNNEEGKKSVVFSPSTSENVSLKKGESKQYKVTFDGKDVTTDSKITWTLDGKYKSGTKIEKGVLTVASDETATEIKFKVKETLSSDAGTTTSFKVTVSDNQKSNANETNNSKGGSSSTSGGTNASSKADNTVAPNVLPKTGTGRMLFGFIIIGGIAIISYKEYRKMREI